MVIKKLKRFFEEKFKIIEEYNLTEDLIYAKLTFSCNLFNKNIDIEKGVIFFEGNLNIEQLQKIISIYEEKVQKNYNGIYRKVYILLFLKEKNEEILKHIELYNKLFEKTRPQILILLEDN